MSLPGWPDYWYGFPPMHYATHAVSPLLSLAGGEVESVVCFGSGTIREEYAKKYGSPFAIETALMKLRGSDLACEVTRSLFDTDPPVPRELRRLRHKALLRMGAARRREARPVLGVRGCEARRGARFRAPPPEGDRPVHHPRGLRRAARAHLLHPGRGPRRVASPPRPRVHPRHRGGHGSRRWTRARAANWTMAGICAHESAMKGGKRVEIPSVR